VKKDSLYSAINSLVSSAGAGDNSFMPSNALGNMLDDATTVLEGVEDILVASKVLIDHKDLIMDKTLFSAVESNEGQDDLAKLQRRVQNLALSNKRASGRVSSTLSSPGWNLASPSAGRNSSEAIRVSTEYSFSKRKTLSQNSFSKEERSPQSSANSAKLVQFFGEGSLPNSTRNSDVF
jgi:hypothetical protein